MKTWIVFVKFTQPGISGSHWSVRYMDSQWASPQHARDRVKELENSLERTGMLSADYLIKILDGYVSDACIGAQQLPTDPTT